MNLEAQIMIKKSLWIKIFWDLSLYQDNFLNMAKTYW
jgi:hypothetical protein